MGLTDLSDKMLPQIEAELHRQIGRLDHANVGPLHDMLTYHMGWSGEGGRNGAGGKRIRPLLLLLSTAAWSDDWQAALPAAAGIEIVHNFSLVHDDIQDNSDTRREAGPLDAGGDPDGDQRRRCPLRDRAPCRAGLGQGILC